MFQHPLFARLLAEVEHAVAVVHLGAFSLECQKSIHLYGNAPWLTSMTRKMTQVEKAAMTRIPKYNSYCVAVRFTWPVQNLLKTFDWQIGSPAI